MAIMFKIGDIDYSNRVLSGSYAMQSNDVYDTWTDANLKEHRSSYRTKVSGSLDMLFKTIEEYQAFLDNLKNLKTNSLTYPITALDNLSNEEISFDGYLSFSPKRRRNDLWQDMVDVVTITITES